MKKNYVRSKNKENKECRKKNKQNQRKKKMLDFFFTFYAMNSCATKNLNLKNLIT